MLFAFLRGHNNLSEQRNLSFIQKSWLCFSYVSNDTPANKTPSVGPSGDPGDVLDSGLLWCYRTYNYWAMSAGLQRSQTREACQTRIASV